MNLPPEETRVLARIAAGPTDPTIRTVVDAITLALAILDERTGTSTPIVAALEQRLRAGLATYGPMRLRTDTRDMLAEVVPELLDALAYVAMHEVREEMRATSDPTGGAVPALLRAVTGQEWHAVVDHVEPPKPRTVECTCIEENSFELASTCVMDCPAHGDWSEVP